MSLAGVAKDTLRIVDEGAYTAPSGARVPIRDEVERAVAGTRLYRPAELAALAGATAIATATATATVATTLMRVEVTGETTASAALRVGVEGRGGGVEVRGGDGGGDVACLNFASAKNPGGGFLGGAKAQEEDLARRSALYPTLLTQREYYDANRNCGSLLYTDHMIWSPRVPFFKDDRLDLVEKPWTASVLTAPAPNAGALLPRDPKAGSAIRATLERRAGLVLDVLVREKARRVVLGAWGCGAFRNDAAFVADVFARLLEGPYARAFERVVFAVYDRRDKQPTLAAFRARFAAMSEAQPR